MARDNTRRLIKTAEEQIATAAGLGMLMASITAIGGIIGVCGLGPWNLLDAAILGVLAYGVYRRSLVAAALLLCVFVVGKGLAWWGAVNAADGSGAAGAIAISMVIFVPVFFNGIRGTLHLRHAGSMTVSASPTGP